MSTSTDQTGTKRKHEGETEIKSESSSSSSSSSASADSVQQQMAAQMKLMADQMQTMQKALAVSQAANKKQKVETKKPANEDSIFNLTSDGRRKVTVRTWNGRLQIDIRDYYQKDGEWAPTKKGLALKPEEFAKLVTWIPKIQEAVADRS